MRQKTILCFVWAVFSDTLVSPATSRGTREIMWGVRDLTLSWQPVRSSARVDVSLLESGFDHLKMNAPSEAVCEQARHDTVLALTQAQKYKSSCMLGGRKTLGVLLLFAVSQPKEGPVCSPLCSLLLALAFG